MSFHLMRAVAAALLLAATPAAAQPAASAAKLDLARRYYAAMHMDRSMAAMMRSMTPAMMASIAKSNPSLTPEQRTAIAEATTESSTAMLGGIVDRLTPIIADTFTEQELRDLVGFYEGPTGQAVVAKMPVIMARFAPQMSEVMSQLQVDVRSRVCAKTDCSKLAKPPG
jgi:hypothetical protein